MQGPFLHYRFTTYPLFSLGAALVATGCTERLLQTADLNPGGMEGANTALIECDDGASDDPIQWDTLPGVAFEPEDSPLVSNTYGALEGPGLYVAARDAFQVYLNGTLVAVSEASRTPTFVPLTLPPGENVLAVAVGAHSGTPASLLHLAELERDYQSDGAWLVSSNPTEGWMNVDFDDGDWSEAVELGDRGDVPGCDPESGFPSSSTARWIGPAVGTEGPVVLRRRVPVTPVGFGETTTGGGQEPPVVISSWDELAAAADSDEPAVIALPEGTYDFRSEPREQEVCLIECPDEPSKIEAHVLTGEEVCDTPLVTRQRNERQLDIKPNKTIFGLGRGAQIRGVTFDFRGNENIIVRNIALFDVNPHLMEAGDAFSLYQPNRVWIDHGTVRWVSDGFTDIGEGSRNITISYMHYDGADELACGNRHGLTSGITDATFTMHHNRFDHFRTRVPLVEHSESRGHLYNNLFTNGVQWAVGSRCLAQVLLEGNVFENVEAATHRATCGSADELGLISAPAGSNLYRDDSNVHLGADEMEPADEVFDPPYGYPLEPATDAWPRVISRAGTGGPWALPISRD